MLPKSTKIILTIILEIWACVCLTASMPTVLSRPLPVTTTITTSATIKTTKTDFDASSQQLSTTKFNLKWTPRSEWEAASPRHVTPINSSVINGGGIGDGSGSDAVVGSGGGGGVPYVIIHHTATKSCNSNSVACHNALRAMQRAHQFDRGWDDIGYNFLIGGLAAHAEIYEGRGFNVSGAHAKGFNGRSIGIALIGNWTDSSPPESMLQKLRQLIRYAVEMGYVREDYKLLGHRQVSATECPGTQFFNELKLWPHFQMHS